MLRLQLLLEAELNLAAYSKNARSPYALKSLNLATLTDGLTTRLVNFFDKHRSTSNRFKSLRTLLATLPQEMSTGKLYLQPTSPWMLLHLLITYTSRSKSQGRISNSCCTVQSRNSQFLRTPREFIYLRNSGGLTNTTSSYIECSVTAQALALFTFQTVSIAGNLDGDWQGVLIGEGAGHLVATDSAVQSIALATICYITFNLSHPAATEPLLELMEFALGVRRKSSLAVVNSMLPLWVS